MDKGNANKEYNKSVEPNYALTITFKYLQCKTPRGQFGETVPFITKLLHQSTIFSLMPEWRHTSGQIHMHCIIKIKDHVKWLKQTLPTLKRQGYILVKPIDDELKWMSYMTKEIDIAKSIIPDCTFPIEKPIKIVKHKDLKTRNLFDDYILNVVNEQSVQGQENYEGTDEIKEVSKDDRTRN